MTSFVSNGTRSWNSGVATNGQTRYYNNGTVTYSSAWFQTTKNYRATPAFKAPYLPGWTITSNVRYSSTFALDYTIPATWNGYPDILVEILCQPVDGRGQDNGRETRKYYEHERRTGQTGRIYISPLSQSYTVGTDKTIYYFRHD